MKRFPNSSQRGYSDSCAVTLLLGAGISCLVLLTSSCDASPQAVAAAAGRPVEPSTGDMQQARVDLLLSIGAGGEPVPGTSTARVVMCQVPDDIVALRRSDPQLARAWRIAVRNAMKPAFDAGYRITSVTRTGWYVLEHEADPA